VKVILAVILLALIGAPIFLLVSSTHTALEVTPVRWWRRLHRFR